MSNFSLWETVQDGVAQSGIADDIMPVLLLCVRHKRVEITPAHVGGDDDAAFALFATDLVWFRSQVDLRELRERHVADLGSAESPYRRRGLGLIVERRSGTESALIASMSERKTSRPVDESCKELVTR